MNRPPISRSSLCLITLLAGMSAVWPQRVGAIDILVYNNNNSGAGSLRQAISDNNALGGGNTIVFSNTVTGTITLTTGELLISTNVTILGPGPQVLTVRDGSSFNRVFNVSGGTVAISSLTIAFGRSSSGGAGLRLGSGSLALNNCLVVSNDATGSSGAGVFALGSFTATNCTFSKNSTFTAGTSGGGAFVSGPHIFVNCAFVQNDAHYGGGLSFSGSAGVTGQVQNVLFHDNDGTFGAGIHNLGSGGFLALTGCTITKNRAYEGGGIYGPMLVRNTIVAGNTNSYTAPVSWDCYGSFISEGYNLIGAVNGSTGFGAVGDQLGTTFSPLNPMLLPLGNYGGLTQTMPPMPGSPAIDQGKSFGLTTDQRGRSRTYDNPAIINSTLGDGTDIGAVEIGAGISQVVTTTNDSGAGSLRQVILNASPIENDTVTFAPNVTNTITLTSGQISLNKSVTILGPTASRLAVSGNSSNRVFQFTGGNSAIHSLNITRGRSSDSGGGIALSAGSLQLYDCQVVSNATTTTFAQGGGIYVYGNASLSLVRSSVTHNEVPLSGGGIAQLDSSMVSIHSSTISSNRTLLPYDGIFGGYGAGIMLSGGTLTVRNSTIASNASSYVGGGIARDSFGSPATDIGNTIIAGNTAVGGAPDTFGAYVSAGYNLIGNSSGGSGFTGTGDQLNVNPLLGPLANYGGRTLTMALRSGSPALDKGKSFGQTTDQRGAPRPFDLSSITNAGGGDASDIGAFELGSPALSIQRSTTNTIVAWPFYYGDFTLQSVTNVAASNNWVNVPGTPAVVGNQNVITNGPIFGHRFYRLKGN
jgi:hypothetical protein